MQQRVAAPRRHVGAVARSGALPGALRTGDAMSANEAALDRFWAYFADVPASLIEDIERGERIDGPGTGSH